MPLQNRVTPWSELVAHPVRYAAPAAMFGNRGCLHDEQVCSLLQGLCACGGRGARQTVASA